MASDETTTQLRRNLELKVRCRDLSKARAAAIEIATDSLGVDRQTDTYFQTRSGRLKLRESSLSGAQLIPYRRPDEPGPKHSDYSVVPVPDPAHVKGLLTELLGVHQIVRKTREIHLFENVRIHLDTVDGLGEFVEFEAVYRSESDDASSQHRKLDLLMRRLCLDEADLVDTSYEALLPPR
jgi:predicted adenylyl cyclase CyaB